MRVLHPAAIKELSLGEMHFTVILWLMSLKRRQRNPGIANVGHNLP
jgi:hypothetical protein